MANKTKRQAFKKGLMMAVLFSIMTISVLAVFDNKFKGSIKKKAATLDSYGRYSGSNDTKDGITMSACASAAITSVSPARNVSLYALDSTITYAGTGTPRYPDYRPTYTSLWGYAWGVGPVGGGVASVGWRVLDTLRWVNPDSTVSINTSWYGFGSWKMWYSVESNHYVPGDVNTWNYQGYQWAPWHKHTFYIGPKLTTAKIGSGVVTSTPFTTDYCGSAPACANNSAAITGVGTDIARTVKLGTWVALYATPSPGWRFVRWTGGPCDGLTTTTCGGFQMQGNHTITAVFEQIPAIPVVTITANPNPVAYNTATNLTWTAANAVGCTKSNSANTGVWRFGTGPNVTGQTNAPSDVLTAARTYTITCWNSDAISRSASVTVNVTPPPLPTVNISATSPIDYNTATSITWTATGATSCTRSNSAGTGTWTGSTGANVTGESNIASELLLTNKTFTVQCFNVIGQSASSSVLVRVRPSLTLTAATNPVLINTPAILTWTSRNARSCTKTNSTATGLWLGTLNNPAPVGSTAPWGEVSIATESLSAAKTFTIQCFNETGESVTQSLAITIRCNAICGACSAPCDGGTQTCTAVDCSTYTQNCNMQACPIGQCNPPQPDCLLECAGRGNNCTDSLNVDNQCPGQKTCDEAWKEVKP